MSKSKKAIPGGYLDFAMVAQAFAKNVVADPGRFGIAPDEAGQLDAAVKRYSAEMRATGFDGERSKATTPAMREARREAEQIIRRLRHLVRLNRNIDAASKMLLGIRVNTAAPKKTPVPLEPPRLRFVRALHEAGASPMHELSFHAFDFSKGRPDGAERLELFVDLIPPDEPIPLHPGANQGGRPWYLWSYTKSPIIIAPPMPRVPMRVLYWGRWAGSGSGPQNVGPFSATCAGWIEGGSHRHLPGAMPMQLGEFGTKPQAHLIDPPVLPPREEKYSVAVLEVHYQSFMPTSTPALDARDATRQLEGPAAEEAA